MNLTLRNSIFQISSYSQSHISKKFQISLKWFQSNSIAKSGNCRSRSSTSLLLITFRCCFHVSKQINFGVIFNSCRWCKLNSSAFSIHRSCIPIRLLHNIISHSLSGNIRILLMISPRHFFERRNVSNPFPIICTFCQKNHRNS